MKVLILKDTIIDNTLRDKGALLNIPDALAKDLVRNGVALEYGAEVPKSEEEELEETIAGIHGADGEGASGPVGGTTVASMKEYLTENNIEFPANAKHAELRKLIDDTLGDDDLMG